MIPVTQLRAGVFFQEKDEVFEVLSYEHIKMGRGSGNVKIKVRNLDSGAIIEKTFTTGASVVEADLKKIKAIFLYKDGDNYYFMDSQSFEQFSLSGEKLGEKKKFLKDGLELYLLVHKEKLLAIELPRVVAFKIAHTGPSYKGNSVTNVYKGAVLENGLEIKVPVFIKTGDIVKVDTKTGEYQEREK